MFCEDKLSEVYHHAVRVKPLRGRSNRLQTADAIRSEPVGRAVILKNSDTIGAVAGGLSRGVTSKDARVTFLTNG